MITNLLLLLSNGHALVDQVYMQPFGFFLLIFEMLNLKSWVLISVYFLNVNMRKIKLEKNCHYYKNRLSLRF